ncbi:hypothetical protein ACIODW_11220 [Streptomyces sp. NPDC087897]
MTPWTVLFRRAADMVEVDQDVDQDEAYKLVIEVAMAVLRTWT